MTDLEALPCGHSRSTSVPMYDHRTHPFVRYWGLRPSGDGYDPNDYIPVADQCLICNEIHWRNCKEAVSVAVKPADKTDKP